MHYYTGIPVFLKNRAVAGVLRVADSVPPRLCGNQAFAFRALTRQLASMLNFFQEKELKENPQPEFLESRRNSFKEKRILLVEENRVNQMLTCNFLQLWGAKVSAVANGREAIKMAGKYSYDLILMDLNMPEMDGYAASGIIRSLNKTYSQVPILAFTASDVEQVRQRIQALFFPMFY